MRILLTGFGEFIQSPEANPSRLLVEGSVSWRIPGLILTTAILPVEYVAGEIALLSHLRAREWDGILCLGVLGNVDWSHIEVQAENTDNAVTKSGIEVPDNAGVIRINHTINPEGERVYKSKLPVTRLVKKLKKTGSLAVESVMGGGNYLCNHIHYVLLHYLYSTNRNIPAGFVHIPANPVRDTSEDIKTILTYLFC